MNSQLDSIRIRLQYPIDRVEEPILYRLVRDYGLIPDIRRADIHPQRGGIIFLELRGEPDSLRKGLDFLDRRGVTVTEIGLDGSDEWNV